MSRSNSRERITIKDIQNIMGYKRTTAYQYYRRIVAKKKARQVGAADDLHIFVDDLAAYSGLSREIVKASLVD